MKKEKSKVLKLKKKYDRLTWLINYKFLISAGITIVSLLTATIGIVASLIPLWLTTTCLTMVALGIISVNFDAETCRKINVKRDKLDEQINKLIDEDSEEKQILNEYQQIKNLEKETIRQVKDKKHLIKTLIEKKNEEAKQHEKLVKLLAEAKKANADEKVVEQIEKQLNENCNIKEQENTINL